MKVSSISPRTLVTQDLWPYKIMDFGRLMSVGATLFRCFNRWEWLDIDIFPQVFQERVQRHLAFIGRLAARPRDTEPTTSMDETGPNQEETFGGIESQWGRQNLCSDGLQIPELGRGRIHAKTQAGHTNCATYIVHNQQRVDIKELVNFSMHTYPGQVAALDMELPNDWLAPSSRSWRRRSIRQLQRLLCHPPNAFPTRHIHWQGIFPSQLSIPEGWWYWKCTWQAR